MKGAVDKIAPRPPVNKLRPLKKSDSSVAGPDWTGVQVMFDDPEWLTKYGKSRGTSSRRSRGKNQSKTTSKHYHRLVWYLCRWL